MWAPVLNFHGVHLQLQSLLHISSCRAFLFRLLGGKPQGWGGICLFRLMFKYSSVFSYVIIQFPPTMASLWTKCHTETILNCERENGHWTWYRTSSLQGVWVTVACPAGKNADISVTQVPIIRMYRSVNLFSLLGRTVFKLDQFSFNQVAAVQCFGQNAAVALLFAPDLTKNLPLDHVFLSLKPLWGKHRHTSRTHVSGSYIYHFCARMVEGGRGVVGMLG